MSVLFGHPSGNPNSHHAALAHYEAGRLAAFCVAWMPTSFELTAARMLPGLGAQAARLTRRSFPPLLAAPKVESRMGEWRRMAQRLMFGGRFADEHLSYEANDWLMRTMKRECRRPTVTAVHAYEDCALWQFEEAARRDKACIYDMPIGYYPAWEHRQSELASRQADWLPAGGLPASRYVRRDQKRREMALADIVLVPSRFVARTIESYMTKRIAICPYGVDSTFWHPDPQAKSCGTLRFVYAGACSLRKGTPVLLEAWEIAGLKDARLDLVGLWNLAEHKRSALPGGVSWTGPLDPTRLRSRYQSSDVFVFPSHFEGYGLVMLEAMACGLPVIATDATAGPEVLDDGTGRVLPAGDPKALAEALTWFSMHRDRLPTMKAAARVKAAQCSWRRYRESVTAAVAGYV